MKSWIRALLSLVIIAIPVMVAFTNCAQSGAVGIEGNDKVADDTNRDSLGAPNPGSGDGEQPALPETGSDLFTRIVNIPISGSSNPTDQKVKILLIVDNSKSMRLVHERLSQSLNSLIQPLKKFHTEIKIITTSEVMRQSGDDLNLQGFSYKSWTYKEGSKPTGEEARILNAQPNETYGIYSYGEYHFLNDKYRYKFTPGESNIEAKLNQLKEDILSISATTNGSRREQGLCNLLLALHDRGPHQFFEKNDMAGVLLISDENDQSFWNNYDTTENRVACRSMYIHGSLQDKTIEKEVVNDAVNFNIYGARYEISYDYNNDGVTEKRNRGDNGGNPLPYDKYMNLLEELHNKKTLACPKDFYDKVIHGYASYLASAAGGYNAVVTGCRVTPTWSAFYNFAIDSDDICKGEVKRGDKIYTDFAEYLRREKNMILVPGSCAHHKSKRAPYRGFGEFYIAGSEDPETNRPLIRDAKVSQASIKTAILNQAKRLFGKEKFFMGNLIHKDNACISDAKTQSLGTDYANLFAGTLFADRIVSEPICSSNYGSVLDGLSAGIVGTIERTYVIANLKPYEIVNRVFIVRNGASVPLSSVQYMILDDRITLDSSVVLVSGDVLRVEILSIPE